MNLTALIKHLRLSILDDTGGTGVVWEDIDEDSIENAQLRWSNEELTNFINEAFKQAHRRALLIKSVEPTFNLAIVNGTSTYTLDSRIIRVKGTKLASTGKKLDELEYEDIMDITDWDTKTGTPTHYIIDYGTSRITLYPAPISNDTVSLLTYREEMAPLRWTAPTGEPDIDERFQLQALYYAASMAYNKDEANTFDPQRSQYYDALFTSEFGDRTTAYAEKRRRRTRQRGISYGGL